MTKERMQNTTPSLDFDFNFISHVCVSLPSQILLDFFPSDLFVIVITVVFGEVCTTFSALIEYLLPCEM